jgi:hypothetical protein
MASDYHLKKNPLDSNRINKLIKDLSDKSKQDRRLALEVYELYKGKAEKDPNAQKTVIESLKLAQSSKESDIKILGLLLKFKEFQRNAEDGDKDKKPDNFFDDTEDDE